MSSGLENLLLSKHKEIQNQEFEAKDFRVISMANIYRLIRKQAWSRNLEFGLGIESQTLDVIFLHVWYYWHLQHFEHAFCVFCDQTKVNYASYHPPFVDMVSISQLQLLRLQ